MGGLPVTIKVVAQFIVGQFRFTIVSSCEIGGNSAALRDSDALFDS